MLSSVGGHDHPGKVAVRFVVFKPPDRQRAHIDDLVGAIGLQNGEMSVEPAGLLHVVTETVLVTFGTDVARQRVQSVPPPECRAIVLIERQDLLRKPLTAIRLDSQIAIQQVEHFSGRLP